MGTKAGAVIPTVTAVEIKTETITRCLLCGTGGKLLYSDCRDYSMGVPGVYGFDTCPSCRLVWLNPRPIPQDVIKCYPGEYYTHQSSPEPQVHDGANVSIARSRTTSRDRLRQVLLAEILRTGQRPSRWQQWIAPVSRVIAAIPSLRVRAVHSFNVTEVIPPFRRGARLLEIGCGSGLSLAKMRNKGWQVFGVDLDPRSVQVARSNGIDAFAGQLQDARLPDASFDGIVMKHVIEHIGDPKAVVGECFRVLAPGGWMGIITPNINSLGHRLFSKHWFALEIPRHLFLFMPSTLKKCVRAGGFEVVVTYTQANMAQDIYEGSVTIREKARGERHDKKATERAGRFDRLERVLLNFYSGCGEEVVLLARKGVEA